MKEHHSPVIIIGGGLAGLSAAYDLGRAGRHVTVLEASDVWGGLASSTAVDSSSIEQFYHFICQTDDHLVQLVEELGLQEKLHWQQTRTSFFYHDKLYGFGTPLDLLRFSPVPMPQRIRFGLNILFCRFTADWRRLDKLPAKTWLIEQIGQRAYDVIWDPLLRVKFGDSHDQVSAAWIWHRIYRVARSRRRLWEREWFGYLELGSDAVVAALLQYLRHMPNVTLCPSTQVSQIHVSEGRVTGVTLQQDGQTLACDAVISTVPLPILLNLVSDFDPSYRARLARVEYLGVVCGMLVLRHSVSDSYWVNINDPDIPFNGVIEYTNLNPRPDLGGRTILYIPIYLPTSAPIFSYSDAQLLDNYVAGLKRLKPDFDASWIEDYQVFRASYAQAICDVGFKDVMPDHRTPIQGLFITDSTQFYPEDRTIDAAVRVGRLVASMIATDNPRA